MSTTLAPSSTQLATRYADVRAFTESLCDDLVTEDFVVQSSPDVSPTKWHLAHTTWFWETFVLTPYAEGYELHDERYPFLFNSYYVQAGERHCRAQRGYLSRPTVKEVFAYRTHVDQAMAAFLEDFDESEHPDVADVLEVGLHHEQQHQELMLTDLKHVFSVNPLRPAYRERLHVEGEAPGPLTWTAFEAGLHEIGFDLEDGSTSRGRFHFDNEGAAPPSVRGSLRDGGSVGDVRRVPRVHGGRRVRKDSSVALPGLGYPRGRKLDRAILLGDARWGVVALHACPGCAASTPASP